VDVHLFIAQSSCRQRQGDNYRDALYAFTRTF